MNQEKLSGKVRVIAAVVSCLLGCTDAQRANTQTDGNELPRVFCLDPLRLAQSRAMVRHGDKSLLPAMEKLRIEADEALKAGPFSVMDKKRTPPSGDKHDYMSLGPYWWPDPNRPDGLPYIRRDGRINPEARTTDTDREAIGQMSDAVETLSLAWYFTDRRPYAEHAAKLLRVWFLDEAAAMNPNLEFGQAIPGRTLGRDAGIIDTARLVRIVDAIGLLESSGAWTAADRDRMRRWCTEYLKWLRTSKLGLGESQQSNNHGTWYDAQVVSLSLFLGQAAPAREILEQVRTRRIDKQIEPDGRQPRELARTKSLGYSAGNLEALFRLATMGRKVGVDLWHHESADGRSLRKALDYLAPYADQQKQWPHEQIIESSPTGLFALLRRGSIVYGDDKYEALIEKMPAAARVEDRTNLLWPRD